MNKEHVLQEVINHLLAQSETIEESAEKAREASIEAPSARQSRSDTTKAEMSWLSEGLTSSSAKIRKQVESLQKVDISPADYVREGSLARLRDKRVIAPETYFILPVGSGIKVESKEGERVVVVTPDSPIGAALMGRKQGDVCNIQIPSGIREVVIELVE